MKHQMKRSQGMRLAASAPLVLTMVAALALGGCTVTRSYEWRQVPGPVRAAQSVSVSEPSRPMSMAVTPPTPGLMDDFARTASDRVYFDTDRWALSSDARETLGRQARWLTRHPGVRVRIEGNADERGSDEHNYMLGGRRAEAVRGYLINEGISAHRISMASHGETRPQESGGGSSSLARNRNARTVIISITEGQ
jgi:peptidoglycan-associated lipoprotein